VQGRFLAPAFGKVWALIQRLARSAAAARGTNCYGCGEMNQSNKKPLPGKERLEAGMLLHAYTTHHRSQYSGYGAARDVIVAKCAIDSKRKKMLFCKKR
jgi:hypothetical protein